MSLSFFSAAPLSDHYHTTNNNHIITPTTTTTVIVHRNPHDKFPPHIFTTHLSPYILRVHILRRRPPPMRAAAVLQDVGATAVVLTGAYGLVLTFDNLTNRKLIHQKLSRKIVHILSGLLFAASWPIFSNSAEARYFASFVPLVNCFRLISNGLSSAPDKRLVKSVTRQGNAEELLRGPLYYVIVLILCTILFWRESPVGVISLSMMCGGDGFADIMGRKFGSMKLPFNNQKSWAGSISMFIFGFSISLGMLYYYSALGYFHLDWQWTMQRVALVALVAMLVESLPTTQVVDDNISVPLISMLAAHMCFS